MMKMDVNYDNGDNTVQISEQPVSADYQSWASKYRSYDLLAHETAIDLGCEFVEV